MKRLRSLTLVFCSAALAAFCVSLHADQYHCPVVSAGAETDSATPSYLNVGQAFIGRGTNATTIVHAGALACIRVGTTCLLCDVDGNGLRDGEDIDDYTRVTITGVGTPRELCAASPNVAAFVACILAGP